MELDSFTEQYLITALFAENDSKGEPLDVNYDIDDIDEKSKEKAQEICRQFKINAGGLLADLDETVVAHDLWLTRKGHGSGFWDGDYSESVGKKLTELAKKLGEPNVTVGDDNVIYIEEP